MFLAAVKKSLKKNFIAGLLIVIPIGLTFLILSFVINMMDDAMSPVVAYIIRSFDIPVAENFRVPGLGIFLILIFIFIVGLMAANYIGKKFVETGDQMIQRMPFVRGIYVTVKKLVQTFSESKAPSFKKMVMVKYPLLNLDAVGFLTCDANEEICQRTGKELVNVLIPTVPNLTVGFMLQVPRDDVVVMDMTVEEGVKFLISIGIAVPEVAEKTAGSPSS